MTTGIKKPINKRAAYTQTNYMITDNTHTYFVSPVFWMESQSDGKPSIQRVTLHLRHLASYSGEFNELFSDNLEKCLSSLQRINDIVIANKHKISIVDPTGRLTSVEEYENAIKAITHFEFCKVIKNIAVVSLTDEQKKKLIKDEKKKLASIRQSRIDKIIAKLQTPEGVSDHGLDDIEHSIGK